MTYSVWMQLPAFVGNKRPWSLIAQAVSAEVVEIYRATFLFPLHVEETPCASSASSSS